VKGSSQIIAGSGEKLKIVGRECDESEHGVTADKEL
jgi:hypothetical protein